MTVCRNTLVLVFIAMIPLSGSASPRYPSLEIQGTVTQNACAPASKKRLRSEIAKKSLPASSRLWKAIDTLLCADKTDANTRYVAGILANKIRDSSWGTGQDPDFAVIKPSLALAESLLAARQAWGATLNFEVKHVSVDYASNEACSAGRTFRYMNRTWRMSEIGNACD